MKCPKCTNEVVKSHAGFTHDGPEYWYCRTCKDEVAFPTPSSNSKLTQAEMDELLILTLYGFSTAEAEQLIEYGRKHGMDLKRAVDTFPNPHTVWGRMAPQEWHEYENKRATALRLLSMATQAVPTLIAGNANTPLLP